MLTAVNTYTELVHFIIALLISLSRFNCPHMQDYVYCVSALKWIESWCMCWQKIL